MDAREGTSACAARELAIVRVAAALSIDKLQGVEQEECACEARRGEGRKEGRERGEEELNFRD